MFAAMTATFLSRKPTKTIERCMAFALIAFLLPAASPAALSASPGPPKLKLRGYITARIDDSTVAILDDHIQLAKKGRVETGESSAGSVLTFAGLLPGQLVEAEGFWLGKHKFSAETITIQQGVLDKSVHETAYLQEEPSDGLKIAAGERANIEADGELLTIGPKAHREWISTPADYKLVTSTSTGPRKTVTNSFYAGRQVHYSGTRRQDGLVEVQSIELLDPAPPEAYKLPHDMKVIPGKDAQSGVGVLEFHRGSSVDGRLKLFPVREVQEYVSQLGDSLLPTAAMTTTRPLEFRFFVVEDGSINAHAFPDGTVLINTGLLGVVDNEAELAFAMSHEIAHVLQAHTWREANETRAAKTGLLIVGIASMYYIGDTGLYLSKVGMAAVSNGHQRSLENQADRLGLQTIIDHGYDPREATKLMRTLVDRYGERSMSLLWSNHDSSVLRGSFLEVQLAAQYPQSHFDGARVNTKEFQAMRDAMGPVKIE